MSLALPGAVPCGSTVKCYNDPGAICNLDAKGWPDCSMCPLGKIKDNTNRCSSLRSPGNSHYLQLESNGALVLYKSNPKTKKCTTAGDAAAFGVSFWRPELAGVANGPYTAHVRDDGSWVVLNKRAAAVWASYSAGPLTAPPECLPNITRAQGCKLRCGLWHSPTSAADDGCNRLWSASRTTYLSLEGPVSSGSIVLRNASSGVRFAATAPGADLRLITQTAGTWTAYVINALKQPVAVRASRSTTGVTGLSRTYTANAGPANAPFSLHVVDTARGNAVLLNKYGKVAWATYDVQPPYIHSIWCGAEGEATFAIIYDPVYDLYRIKGWGFNGASQCGQPALDANGTLVQEWIGDNLTEMGDALPYIDLGTDVNRQYPLSVKAVASGEWHSCALTSNGLVKCWGGSDMLQLGYGSSNASVGSKPDQLGDALPPVEVNFAFPGGVRVVTVATGDEHTCVIVEPLPYNGITPARRLRCWGQSAFGQAGPPNSMCKGFPPTPCVANIASQPDVDVGPLSPRIDALYAGSRHTCVVLNGNTIRCFGDNSDGQLGYGDILSRGLNASTLGVHLLNVNLGGPVWRVVNMALGQSHTCAAYQATSTGGMKVKNNRWGQLGLGDAAPRGNTPGTMGLNLTAVKLPWVDQVNDMCAGWGYTCVLGRLRDSLLEDRVYCWGRHSALGMGGLIDHNATLPDVGDEPGDMGLALRAVPLGTNLLPKSIACGWSHWCVKLYDTLARVYRVKCFGQAGSTGQGLPYGYSSYVGDDFLELEAHVPYTNLGV
ncbi:hypothetical protein HYH03_004217 [Edaphochlamys debaryana]|uniref:Bulb-type lectin domain-containing protein n=1 Tax=Edaphochlamys debaryana TaxID=47281 RepID=A0A835Y7Z8_9CHLO|nr:hypothetical protein HYH03_004217 [Edaphochlamys debaryana]|eukprot:KAG2497955.1 hypothetical protein HYH03_004217 [Edaphochlamys debaryana]